MNKKLLTYAALGAAAYYVVKKGGLGASLKGLGEDLSFSIPIEIPVPTVADPAMQAYTPDLQPAALQYYQQGGYQQPYNWYYAQAMQPQYFGPQPGQQPSYPNYYQPPYYGAYPGYGSPYGNPGYGGYPGYVPPLSETQKNLCIQRAISQGVLKQGPCLQVSYGWFGGGANSLRNCTFSSADGTAQNMRFDQAVQYAYSKGITGT